MEKTRVEVKVTEDGGEGVNSSWTVEITNSSEKLAFFLRPQLMAGDEEVLPSFWSAGYFTLAPSESRTITVSCPKAQIEGMKTWVKVLGWNVNQ
jgi:hypothetical protein